MAVVQMQSASAENLCRKVQLLDPIVDDGSTEESLSPLIHFSGNVLGSFHENRIAMDSKVEIALVIERHRRYLAQRVLSLEHPSVGARQKRIRNIANTLVDGAIRLCSRAVALNPLALKI